MKEKEVTFGGDGHQVVYIVEKEDGTYGTKQAGSYLMATYPGDYQEKLAHWARQNLDDLANGVISTVGFHMQRLRMTAEDVADRTGLRLSAVRKHMTPKGFSKATVETLWRYAEVFGVPVTGMLAVAAQAPREEQR